jgi:hypothetical protein
MLHIATVATHSERYFPVLEKMINDKKIEFHKLAHGKKYEGHSMKDKEMIKLLKTLPGEDIVVFVDGFDSLLLTDGQEILDKFKSYGKKVIISIENIKNSFMMHSYHFQEVLGKYINTGLYMGEVKYLLIILQNIYENSSNYTEDDQYNWGNFVNNSDKYDFDKNLIGVDTESKIFLNHSFTCSNSISFDKKKKRLVLNGKETPCFIQGNGAVNMNDIIKNMGYEKDNVNKNKMFLEGIKYSYKAVFDTYPVLKFYIAFIILGILVILFSIYGSYKIRKNSNVNFVFS